MFRQLNCVVSLLNKSLVSAIHLLQRLRCTWFLYAALLKKRNAAVNREWSSFVVMGTGLK